MAGLGGRKVLVRFGAPAAFLAAAAAALLLVRAGLERDVQARPATPGRAAAAAVVRPAPKPATPVRDRFYVIRAGDTLEAVAQRTGTSVEHLLALNPGVRPTSLRIGQKIRTG